MNTPTRLRTYLILCGVVAVLQPFLGFGQSKSPASITNPRQTVKERDGQHDFDFNIGAWKIHISRRLRPLTGSAAWVEYDGVAIVRKLWNGRASVFELDARGDAGRIEGVGLRLYNPEARQWSLNWASSSDGVMTRPQIDEFKNGRGVFYGQEPFKDRAIFIRQSFSDITTKSSRFEQAFSDDGGKTWETNWIMTFALVKDK